MPLRALLNDQDFFAENLTEENRQNCFICPNCPSHLIAVIPQKNIIKHFRHRDGQTHYEPETEEHFTGKNKLKEIAKLLGFEATTEYRIGKHITDVYVKSPIPLAIEFQCSKCNSDEIADRTITYAENGVSTLWILGQTFNEDALTNKQTKIENQIERNQPLIRFNGEKFLIKKRFKKYHEYAIDYHIKQMGYGNCPNNWSNLIKVHGISIEFDEDKDNRLLKAASVLAKKTRNWTNQNEILFITEHAGLLSIVLTLLPKSNGFVDWLLTNLENDIDNIVSDHWEIFVQ